MLDIVPRTDGEVVFTIVGQMFGAVIFGLVIGTVGEKTPDKTINCIHPLSIKLSTDAG